MNKIFVTGPTGTQGFPIVKELLAKGFQVRAFALESDPKLPQLKELGPNVEVYAVTCSTRRVSTVPCGL